MSPLEIKNVLVVDNDSDTRNFIARLAEELGHHAILASNGPEALELSIHAGPFDAIVISLYMPHHMDGLELAKIIRHVASTLPIIMMHSGLGKPGQYTMSHLRGFADHIVQKPIIGETFKKLLEQTLAGRPEAAITPFPRLDTSPTGKNS